MSVKQRIKTEAKKTILSVAKKTTAKSATKQTVDFKTGTDFANDTLFRVTSLLEKADIDYFIVRGEDTTRHCIGILQRDQARTFRVLSDANSFSYGVYDRPNKPTVLTKIGRFKESFAMNLLAKKKKSFCFWAEYQTPDKKAIGSVEFGCDVEFWAEGDRLQAGTEETRNAIALIGITDMKAFKGALIAPRTNRVTAMIPKSEQQKTTITIGNQKLPTFKLFTEKLLDDIDFPIDAVYTWVDGTDETWLKKMTKYRFGEAAEHVNNSDSRFVGHDELRHSLRSINMYAPFIRTIYIVTDDQVPDWLDTKNDRVKIVSHKDIFKHSSALPVFNSHAIESQLHHIEGLSEHYLYLNDDFFFGRPVSANKFFTASGLAKVNFSPSQLGVGPATKYETAPGLAGKNIRKLLLESHGRYITNKIKHTPQPQLKSVMNEIEKNYSEALKMTEFSKFRSDSDVSLTSTFHHSFAYMTGRAISAQISLRVIDITQPNAKSRIDDLLRRKSVDTFCLNEIHMVPAMAAGVDTMVRAFLSKYYPSSSEWEK